METVTSCTKVRDWTKDGKSVPIYSVVLSNGQTAGESFGKEIPSGTPVSELEITPNGSYAPKVKWNKPGASGGGYGGGGKKSGNESFALSYAKDIVVAGKTDFKNLFTLADKMYDWLENKKPKQTASVVLASQLPTKQQEQNGSDDLPF